jgi:hypothetical protein
MAGSLPHANGRKQIGVTCRFSDERSFEAFIARGPNIAAFVLLPFRQRG